MSYNAPGVYVEEVNRGSVPIQGVSMSTAGFLGPTERGPVEPQLVTSFSDYRRTYGGFDQYDSDGRLKGSYLAYAVAGFFDNGGQRAFIGRIIDADEVGEAGAIADAVLTDDSDDPVIEIDANSPGLWGENVIVVVDEASRSSELFGLTVYYWVDAEEVPGGEGDSDDLSDYDAEGLEDQGADVVEFHDNLSDDSNSSDFYETKVNAASDLIELTPDESNDGVPDYDSPQIVGLEDASDVDDIDSFDEFDYEGNDEKGAKSGLAAFEEIPEIAMVIAPDEAGDDALAETIEEHCSDSRLQDRVAILQAEQDFDIGEPEPPVNSSYAAFYFPWVEVTDPVSGRLIPVPPAGHVAGIYARTDSNYGVHKAPANQVVRGVRGLDTTITKAEQAGLNPKGVNCIRSFSGRGIRVWGARTTASDPTWQYINVRRLFIFLRESIDNGTQWAVFEPNNEDLWARVRQTIRGFLRDVWEDGALMGETPEEAFFVTCDRTTMTQNDIENGRLICEIGVAPVRPAEFVIFRISQWDGED